MEGYEICVQGTISFDIETASTGPVLSFETGHTVNATMSSCGECMSEEHRRGVRESKLHKYVEIKSMMRHDGLVSGHRVSIMALHHTTTFTNVLSQSSGLQGLKDNDSTSIPGETNRCERGVVMLAT